MNGHYIEPRKVMWAVAEISGLDAGGTSFRVPAVMEDTSPSGACVRMKRPLAVGSHVTVKWHREQFPAVARNCHRDGNEFLVGVSREPENAPGSSEAASEKADAEKRTVRTTESCRRQVAPSSSTVLREAEPVAMVITEPETVRVEATNGLPATLPHRAGCSLPEVTNVPTPRIRALNPTPSMSSFPERNTMQPKTMFPHFWRRKQDSPDRAADAPGKSTHMEAHLNKPKTDVQTPSGPRGELLSYEDIYRAAGILSPGSGYGIHKVVDMLNSERLRDLSKEARRASVLMALDAAGISADEMLTDATRRQNALSAYETSQVKQLEDFETRKAKENSKIEAEMEKIRVHYAERVQANLDQVAGEKEALRNWQNAMQHETQRIGEVIELCGKQPAAETSASAMAAGAGVQGAGKAEATSTNPPATANVRPTLLSRN